MILQRKNMLQTWVLMGVIGMYLLVPSAQAQETSAQSQWAFEETFSSDPASPSQDALPRSFEYMVTHRRDSGNVLVDYTYDTFVGDHAEDCSGPVPLSADTQDTANLHDITTSHLSNSSNPDGSFFICKNHMMSAMGHVSGYSVASFWPKQEFNFATDGVLEFDTNINDDHSRSWWEVVISKPEDERVAPAMDWLPIDEQYSANSIVLRFTDRSQREIMVMGTEDGSNNAVVSKSSCEWGQEWCGSEGNDPATNDRRIRRTHRIELKNNKIIWSVQKADGTFDAFEAAVPAGLPLDQGLVMFKQHAYTPEKDGNTQRYTTHWDNIKFSGPVLQAHASYDASNVIKLHANGNVNIGAEQTTIINIPKVEPNAWIFAQLESPMKGQVEVSINGGAYFSLFPKVSDKSSCDLSGWHTATQPIPAYLLHQGANTITWRVGPRPSCATSWKADGFAAKNIQIRFMDSAVGGIDPSPVPSPVPTPSPSPSPSPTPSPTALPTNYSVEYFSDKVLGTSVLTEEVPEINFDWKKNAPAAGVPADGFSARYTKTVAFKNGVYDFTLSGDDGVRLLIDGEEIINGWRNQAYWTYNTQQVMTEGEKQIVVEYYENKNRASLSFDFAPALLFDQNMCVMP